MFVADHASAINLPGLPAQDTRNTLLVCRRLPGVIDYQIKAWGPAGPTRAPVNC